MLWWEEFPGRYKREIQAFEKAKLKPQINQEQLRKGILDISVVAPNPDQTKEKLNFRIIYPELFPYFRFEIFSSDLNLSRHQNPFQKNLCFIGRATKNWRPSDTAASFLINRLSDVLKSARDPLSDEAAVLEEEQGEPFSDYYQKSRGFVMVSDFFDTPLTGKKGKFTWRGIRTTRLSIVGIILELFDFPNRVPTAKQELYKFCTSLSANQDCEGFWVKLKTPLKEGNPKKFFNKIVSEHGFPKNHKEEFYALGVNFPEEGRWRQSTSGWIFVIRQRKRKGFNYFFVSAERFHLDDQYERIPELTFLKTKTVSLVGLGCIGSVVAIEFAKAHLGTLKILDQDSTTPGNIVRWPLGLFYSGLGKSESLQIFFENNFIYTKIISKFLRIGATQGLDETTRNQEEVEEFLSKADLIFDATAEIGVNQYLADWSRKNNIPFVWAEGRNGGYGGIVGRCKYSQEKGCWNCFDLHLRDGNISTPHQNEEALIQPISCSDPTFVGSGFDLSYISLAAVRLAIATLNNGKDPKGYPDFDWDIGVVNLRDKGGKPCAPKWETYQLVKHPKCPFCGSES